ncbi:MAG: transglycosylase SLT domain-containing protein [Gammaproteobacteria bacterium]|nr:transglycosylase SLT domain-containing protein [Gammaproteobacteria bacterium]
MTLRISFLIALLGLIPTALADATADATPDAALVDLLARSIADAAQQDDHFDAQVWLMSSDPKLTRYLKDEAERKLVLQTVYQEAIRHDIDADLILAVMQVESAFDRFAISSAGAQGLMQVMPFWRNEIGRPQDNLTDVRTNVRYGSAILAHYLTVSRSDLVDALARYNGSRGKLNYPELVIRAYRGRWQTLSNDMLPGLTNGCRDYGLAACGPLGR